MLYYVFCIKKGIYSLDFYYYDCLRRWRDWRWIRWRAFGLLMLLMQQKRGSKTRRKEENEIQNLHQIQSKGWGEGKNTMIVWSKDFGGERERERGRNESRIKCSRHVFNFNTLLFKERDFITKAMYSQWKTMSCIIKLPFHSNRENRVTQKVKRVKNEEENTQEIEFLVLFLPLPPPVSTSKQEQQWMFTSKLGEQHEKFWNQQKAVMLRLEKTLKHLILSHESFPTSNIIKERVERERERESYQIVNQSLTVYLILCPKEKDH